MNLVNLLSAYLVTNILLHNLQEGLKGWVGTARQSVQCKPINHVRRFALNIKFTVSNKTLVHLLYFMKKVIQERKVVVYRL